jgi:uncharacterized protein YqgC (DUF456 family)
MEDDTRIILGASFVIGGVIGLVIPLIPGILLIGVGLSYMGIKFALGKKEKKERFK